MTRQKLTVTPAAGDGQVKVLSVTGELDHDSRQILGDAAEAAFQAGHRRLVLDLAGVTFSDSGGLSMLVDLHKRAATRGGQLRLAAVQPPVTTVLLATNLDRMLLLHPTVDAAVDAASAAG